MQIKKSFFLFFTLFLSTFSLSLASYRADQKDDDEVAEDNLNEELKRIKPLFDGWDNSLKLSENLKEVQNRLPTVLDFGKRWYALKKKIFKKQWHDEDPKKPRYNPERSDRENIRCKAGLLDREEYETDQLRTQARMFSHIIPDQSSLQAGISNPFVLPEPALKKYASYTDALYAYFFCSDEVFKAECANLSKEDQKSIAHYTKVFEAVLDGLKKDEDIDLASASPVFLKSNLLKKTMDALIEYLDDPDFDPANPKLFDNVAVNQLVNLFNPLTVKFKSKFLGPLINYALRNCPEDKKEDLGTFYLENKGTLLVEVFLKDYDKDDRLKLAKFLKRFNISKMVQCTSANELKAYLNEIKVSCFDDEVTIGSFVTHALSTAASVVQYSFFPVDTLPGAAHELLEKRKAHFNGFMARYKEAIKKPITDRKSFEKQSLVQLYEEYFLNDFLRLFVQDAYARFKSEELSGLCNMIKGYGLPLILYSTEDELRALFDKAEEYFFNRGQNTENELMALAAPLIFRAQGNGTPALPLANDRIEHFVKVERILLDKLQRKITDEASPELKPYAPYAMYLIPEGALFQFLTKSEEEFLTFWTDHLSNLATPFVKCISHAFKEYAWQQVKQVIIYDENREDLISPLSTANDIPTYIDLFYDLKAGKCTNPGLIAYYDAIKWNTKTDRAIIFKEANTQALSEQEQMHKDYYQTLPIPFYAQRPYFHHIESIKTFIKNANITSEEEYNVFVKATEKNRFALILHKNAENRTDSEESILKEELISRAADFSKEFTFEEIPLLFNALKNDGAIPPVDPTDLKAIAEQERKIAQGKALIVRLEEALRKIVKPLITEQKDAIEALDQLKKIEAEASIAEHRYILFINNRELLLKQHHDLDLSSQERAKIQSLEEAKADAEDDKEIVLGLHEDIDFIKDYNALHPKITANEIKIRERFRVIAKGLYKHNVDLLQYRLSQTEHTTFLNDPLLVASSVVFSMFNDPVNVFGQKLFLPSLPASNSNIFASAIDFVKQLSISAEEQLHDLLITQMTSPELVAIRDAYLQTKAGEEVQKINFLELLEAYKVTPVELTQREKVALLQASLFTLPIPVSEKDGVTEEVPLYQLIKTPLQFSSLISRSKITPIRNADSLYMQIPYLQTAVNILDSTPMNVLDNMLLGNYFSTIKEGLLTGLNSLNEVYFQETPKTSSFKEYVDVHNNPDPNSPVKKEAESKKMTEMTDEMKRKIKEKMLNDDLAGIKSEQKAKEQNNRILASIKLTDDVSVGITPYDIRSIAYGAGEAFIATKIDSLIAETKTAELKDLVLGDQKLLGLFKSIDSTTRNRLTSYEGKDRSFESPASIIDDRPKQGLPSPLSLLPALPSFKSTSKKKKKEAAEQSLILKKPKYNPSAANKLRMHLEGSETQNGILTPLINNPRSLSLWKHIGLKTIFTTLITRLREAAVGQNSYLRSYENVDGTLKPKKDSLVITPSNIDPLVVAGAALRPNMLIEAGAALNETSEAIKYVPQIITNLEKTSGINLSGGSLTSLPKSLASVAKMLIPNEVQILRLGEEFIFSEYTSATILSIFGTFFEYLLYDKVSSRKLSLYFQQNIDQLEGLMKEYQKAKKQKDSFAIKKVEKRFEKFMAKSKIAFADRSLVLKLLPRLFLLFNLVARFGKYLIANNKLGHHLLNPNAFESGFLTLLQSFLGINDEEMDTTYKVAMTGAIGAIGYSLWKSFKLIENNYYN